MHHVNISQERLVQFAAYLMIKSLGGDSAQLESYKAQLWRLSRGSREERMGFTSCLRDIIERFEGGGVTLDNELREAGLPTYTEVEVSRGKRLDSILLRGSLRSYDDYDLAVRILGGGIRGLEPESLQTLESAVRKYRTSSHVGKMIRKVFGSEAKSP